MKLLLIVLFLIFVFSFKVSAQEKRVSISGKLNSNELPVENIHILNKSSRIGTISNSFGEFQIVGKVNDTLIISGIQFYYKEIIITQKQYLSKVLVVELFQKTNELDVVEVKAHNLSGSLALDSHKVSKPTSKVSSNALDFSMIDFSKQVILDVDAIDRIQPPDISHLVNPMAPGVGSYIGFGKYISKGEKKLKRRKKEDQAIQTFRNNFSDYFFTETLKIPREKIDAFILHCKAKGIFSLYKEGGKITIIDSLFKESKYYNK